MVRPVADTYKAPSGLTRKSLGLYDEKYNGYIGPAIGSLALSEVRNLQTIQKTKPGRPKRVALVVFLPPFNGSDAAAPRSPWPRCGA